MYFSVSSFVRLLFQNRITLDSCLVIHRTLCSRSASAITMRLHRGRESPSLHRQRTWLSVRLTYPVAPPGALLLQAAGSCWAPLNVNDFGSKIHVYLSTAHKMLCDSLLPVLDIYPSTGLRFSLWAVESALKTHSDQTSVMASVGWTIA